MKIDKICRACLHEDDKMIDMSEKDIYQKFLLFANLTAREEIPDISPNLCQSCEQKLNNALDFREKCQNSHEILLNYLNNSREVKIEVTDADNRHVDSEAQIPFNYVENTCEFKIEAPDVDSEAQISFNYVENTREVEIEAPDVDTHQVDLEAQIPLNYIKNTREVTLKATYVDVQRPWQLEQFPESQVWEVIKDLKQSYYKNTNCIQCSYVGKHSRALSMHMSQVHEDFKPRWCYACNGEFDNLTDHVATNHSDYTCKFCSRKFHGLGRLTHHLRNHSDVKSFQCSFCESKFNWQSHLNVHLRKHMKEKHYKCGTCSYASHQSHKLTKHMKKHDVDKPRVDRPHVCLMCNRTFTTDAMLTSHINTHEVSFLEI